MEPTVAPSDLDKRPKKRVYEAVLNKLDMVVNRLDVQAFLFVIAIAILFVVLLLLATVIGARDLRFVVLVIAFLAVTVIIGYYILELRGRVGAQREQLKDQQEQINRLVTAMSPNVFRHLAGIYILKSYLYRQNYEVENGRDAHGEPAVGDLFQRECYYLKHRGFIEPPTLEFDTRLHLQNLAKLARPTELGLLCLKLQKKDIVEIEDNGIKWIDIKDNLKRDAVKKLGLKVDLDA